MDSFVKVSEVLSTKGFEGSRVVSGQAGLEKVCKTVTVAEVPDAMDWLIGGELVVTTAYYLKDDPRALEKWVNGLIDHGAVALAIKSSRFIGVIPEVIKKIGREKAFPIIELPPNVTWPEILESVTKLLLSRQEGALKEPEEINNRLMELVIDSKGINAIAATLSELIAQPVIIEDRWFNTLAYSPPSNEDEEYLLKVRTDPEYLSVLAQRYDQNRSCNGGEFYQDTVLQTPFKTVKQAIFPVSVENRVTGFLTVLLSDGELQEKDYKVVKHGVTVIALELSKQKMMIEAYGRLRLDILRTLLESADTVNKEFCKKAMMVGFDLTGPLTALLIKEHGRIEGVEGGFAGQSFINDRFAMTIRAKLEEFDRKAFVLIRQDDLVAFIHAKKEQAEDLNTIKRFLLEECQQWRARGRNLLIGVGNFYRKVEDYKKSFREAEIAVSVGGFFRLEPVVAYAELGFYRLLGLIEDQNELKNYCHALLDPLLLHDEENKGDLLLTLENFLNNNGNQAEVARQMFLHVNTIPYRIKKIEEIIGVDLNRADVRVTLFLALAILKNNVIN